ncbi:signal peptidase I [Arthrobacter sp. Hz1]
MRPTIMLNRLFRRLLVGFLAAAAVALTVIGAAIIAGQAAVVTTDGASMNPVYNDGDLVAIGRAPSYSVGQIAAYRLPGSNEVVLHRIIGGGQTAFVFKGDNSQSIDTVKPSAEDLVGRELLHIPQGGVWLDRLASPPMLALMTFALVAGGGTTITRRRRRQSRQRRADMSRHTVTGTGLSGAARALPPLLRVGAAVTLILAIIASTLVILAWTGPLNQPAATEPVSGARMKFSYTAEVGNSPAYDGTVAESPDPVFRSLADTVDVHFAYQGEPGSVTVSAELSTLGGWRTTIPLQTTTSFLGTQYEGTVELDLATFEDKARAASAVTGLPESPILITLTPRVQTAAGPDFEPALTLELAPLQLSVPGAPDALTVTNDAPVGQALAVPRTLGPEIWNLTAANARIISAALILLTFLAGITLTLLARRNTPVDEGAAIRRRYSALLVRVHPMPAPQGQPVIDVTTFATLAKLAERYGLLVLHWDRSDVETFVVHDESTTYRYRTNSETPPTDVLALTTETDSRINT